MREILFRGKTVSGDWVFGLLAHIKNSWYISNKAGIPTAYEFIPKTVGQYTGVTDKNRTKIFEGDIVTGYFNHEKIVGYIFYGGNAQFFIQRDGIYGIGLDNSDCWLEVIGNIYDNPELLEDGEEDD